MLKQYTSPYKSVKISDGFWIIEQNGVRCYLFEGDDMALLVDAGFGGDLKAVCEGLTDKPVQLLITHADGDHMGSAAQFGLYYMHPAEYAYHNLRHETQPDAIPVWEGDKIDIGTFCFEIVLIPGHTPGSIALLEREKRFILTGDTVGKAPIYMFGAGRNLPAYLVTIGKLIDISPAFDTIWPSHGQRPLKPDILDNLRLLAAEILAGKKPDPQPTAPHMPDDVKLYSDYGVGFYLEE